MLKVKPIRLMVVFVSRFRFDNFCVFRIFHDFLVLTKGSGH